MPSPLTAPAASSAVLITPTTPAAIADLRLWLKRERQRELADDDLTSAPDVGGSGGGAAAGANALTRLNDLTAAACATTSTTQAFTQHRLQAAAKAAARAAEVAAAAEAAAETRPKCRSRSSGRPGRVIRGPKRPRGSKSRLAAAFGGNQTRCTRCGRRLTAGTKSPSRSRRRAFRKRPLPPTSVVSGLPGRKASLSLSLSLSLRG